MNRLLPFLRWWPLKRDVLRADIVAGISVALVLVPQSMAYAQLAGMPAYYGLYAGFLPVIVAALWGSSNQLAHGPAAVSSILTASALAPLATLGSENFVALAILLAFMVGVIQLALGLCRMGNVVSFLSHPVILGFTSAAAIIIGLSQLNKLFGLPLGRSDFFLGDVWQMLLQMPDAHLPSLAIGIGAIAVIWAFRRWLPRWPGVLVAVALGTAVSWGIGFERKATAPADAFADPHVLAIARDYQQARAQVRELDATIEGLRRADSAAVPRSEALARRYEIELKQLERTDLERENAQRLRDLRQLAFHARHDADGAIVSLETPAAGSSGGGAWRIRDIRGGRVQLSGGGEVVGTIPAGLPSIGLPQLSWDAVRSLISAALVMALIGFVEAVSIGKAMAARTRQRIDANQELLGQGLANIAGSLTQAFPTMGSFSRSAVNISAGARTGMASVVTGLLMLLTLVALTPLLYHLPQAVLAAVIMMAVTSLFGFRAMNRAWRAHRHDGIAAWVTFFAALLLAPAIDYGVLIGAVLAVLLYLFRTMRPRMALLSRHPDGTLRDARVHGLPTSERLVVLRFDGSLYFANVPYFEDSVLEAVASFPQAREVLIVCEGLNAIDASGVEVIEHLSERLAAAGITLSMCAVKLQVMAVFDRTGLSAKLGPGNLFRSADQGIAAIALRTPDPTIAACLMLPRPAAQPAAPSASTTPSPAAMPPL
ncbi:MAG: STAS domain-containing protein [Betaproteobacteria bacterium]|nr:STAS domain-containing protein [Betaproteobacteria bacterium]